VKLTKQTLFYIISILIFMINIYFIYTINQHNDIEIDALKQTVAELNRMQND
jgi:hypothetical protein